ncbi:MAG: hypothetical protein HUJ66_07645 [Oscillospiraceae bacterium]|nr:hypothetical protein [Oscillospiraceae bacterium]
MKKSSLRLLGIVIIVCVFVLELLRLVKADLPAGPLYALPTALILLTFAAFFLYWVMGASKPQRKLFSAGLAFYALSALLMNVLVGTEGYAAIWSPVFDLLTSAVSLAVVSVLLFAKDLGEKKSVGLSVVMLALAAAELVASVLPKDMSLAAMNRVLAAFSDSVADLALALLILIAVSAKYADKAERHAADGK